MRLGLSRTSRRITHALWVLSLIAIFVISIFTLCRLKPAFIEYSKKYANNIANNVVNEAVNEVFSDDKYSDITFSDTNSASDLRTVETDAVKVNMLKAKLNESILDNIKNRETETVGIPLGSATDVFFLAGLGPQIPIKIYPAGIVNTDLREEFNSAGINQVNHKIYLDVSIDMSFIGLLFSESETVNTSALLSETVIVGDTPTYYGSGNLSASVN